MPEEVELATLPSNLQAEAAVLGACMIDDVALIEATNALKPQDFYLSSHQRLFAVIAGMHKKGEQIDTLTVTDVLRKRHELDAVGGPLYVSDLPSGLPRKFNVEGYVRIIHDAARRRDLYRLTDDIGKGVLANEDNASQLIAQTKRWLEEIESETGTDTPMQSVGEYLADRYAHPEQVFDLDPREQGIPSGFAWQDDKTGGYIGGKLYILAARPSMGKTAKLVNDVSNVSLKAKVPVALFTFEQDKSELLQRLLCCRATANLTDFMKGRSDAGDKDAIRKAYQDYVEAPLYWDDTPGLTVSQIRAKCIRLKKDLAAKGKKLGAIFIDQLSFLSWADIYEKGQRTDQLIGTMTRNLKKLARELGVPVILVAQLNRGATKNKDAKPTLADLKESGSIEENADVVAFLHRAEYYDRTDDSLRGKGEYIIAKQRQGPVGSHVLKYMAQSVKWLDEWTPRDGDDDGEQIPW